MKLDKLRILGSGFTEEEYNLYGFSKLKCPEDAMDYLSNRLNDSDFRPAMNPGFQKHFLEDKWLTQKIFESLGIPATQTYGLYHPEFGMTADGKPMKCCADVEAELRPLVPCKLFIKPRGGRKGRNLVVAELFMDCAKEEILVVGHEGHLTLTDFIEHLPASAFGEYHGSYHGWLIQSYIKQHEFLNKINPHTVNTIRIITLLNANNQVTVRFSVLRFGVEGSSGDNWSTGGIAVAVNPETGELGDGVYTPKYGGETVTEHPDTGVRFKGHLIPHWDEVMSICKQAASLFSGIRSIGWDIALTPNGPVIIEGNADWGVPSVQVHIKGGFLTPDYRAELAELGLQFPKTLAPIPIAIMFLIGRRWRQSRWPHLINRLVGRNTTSLG